MTKTQKPAYKLPERKWYSLEQARQKISKLTGEDFTMEDLIHFSGIGKLKIKTQIVLVPERLHLGYKTILPENINYISIENNETDISIMIQNEDFKILKGEYGLFESILNFGLLMPNPDAEIQRIKIGNEISKLTDGEYVIEGKMVFYNPYFDYGKELMNPDCIEASEIMLEYQSESYFQVRDGFYEIPEKLHIQIFISLKEAISFSTKKFFISNEDIYDFLDGKTNIDLNKEREKLERKESVPTPSKTVQENQIAFIKTLLFMHYGVKTAEEARQLLRNSPKWDNFKREHAAEIEALNLKIPSDNTLQNWYKQSS